MRLTVSRTQRYRPTPPVHALKRTLALLAIAVAIGCSSDPSSDPAPLDRFTFPVGLAVHDQDLLVVSSNFDLRYATSDGGSLLRVALGDTPSIQPGGLRIGSFGGEVAVVDPVSCPAVAATQALVTSRLADRLYRVGLEGGTLSCGAGCEVPFDFDSRLGDPYGIGVTCPPGGTPRAWIGFLRTPLREGLIASIDLSSPSTPTVLSMGAGNVQSFAYDAETARLFMTGIDTGLSAPLRWIELGGGCDPSKAETDGGCFFKAFDLWPFLRGAELSGIALSNPHPGLAAAHLPQRPRLRRRPRGDARDPAGIRPLRPAHRARDRGGRDRRPASRRSSTSLTWASARPRSASCRVDRTWRARTARRAGLYASAARPRGRHRVRGRDVLDLRRRGRRDARRYGTRLRHLPSRRRARSALLYGRDSRIDDVQRRRDYQG